MKFYRLLSISAAILLSLSAARAQNPQAQTPEQQEKQLLEYVDKEVRRLGELLDLEYWQEFYVDSILVHDYQALSEELKELQTAKVGNADLYQAVQDKWAEQIENSFKRYFTEEQWKKYSKSTAGEKKKRDKRKEKRK